jgi:type II secretory pathway component PulF
VGVSHVIRSYGLIVAAVVMIAVFWIRNWFKTPQGSRFWENALLRSPIAGSLVAKFAMSRFCRMLGTLLAAGVPLISGLQVARKSLGNQILVDAVSESIERVQKGEPLGASLAGCKTLFSGAVLEMIAVAEETGKLDQELVRLANVTESDLDRQLKTAVAFAEPLMLFFIAAFIGTIFIGMVIPIFTMQDYIK